MEVALLAKVLLAMKTASALSRAGYWHHIFTTVSRVVFAKPVLSISAAKAMSLCSMVVLIGGGMRGEHTLAGGISSATSSTT